MRRTLASIAGLLAHRVAAHGGCLNYTVGDTWYPGYSPYDDHTAQDALPWMVQRSYSDVNPIFEPANLSLPCNTPGAPVHGYIPIAAGANITAVYGPWVHTVGPMIAWMAHCPADDCYTADAASLAWFKIGEKGLQSGTIMQGDWFQRTFSRWDGSPNLWSETVPRGLRKGRYLVRHEIISLHSANKPQFYPECANLEVSGDGEAYPEDRFMAKIPGVWSMDQPEINIDVYSPEVANLTVYNIPGPPVWTG